MSLQHDVGTFAPNKRSETIKRTLAKPPKRAAFLVLFALGAEQPLTLGEWTRDEVLPLLAGEIELRLVEHAEQAGIHESRFALTFLDEARNQIQSTPLRHRPSTGDAAADVQLQLDGSGPSQLAQTQFLVAQQFRYLEVMQRGLLTAQAQQQSSLLAVIERLSEREAEALKLLDEARAEADALREALAQRDVPAESPSQERAVALLEKVVPLALAQAAAGGK